MKNKMMIIHTVPIYSSLQNLKVVILLADMADNYYGQSRSKSSRHMREYEDSKSRSRSSRSNKNSKRRNDGESKTPPLPTKSVSSITDLMKQRQSLKKELQQIKKNYDHDIRRHDETKFRKRKYSDNDNHNNRVYHRKRHYDKDEKKRRIKETTPEHHTNYGVVESEDEEAIIEERRKQRKQLLEKLKEKPNDENVTNDSNKNGTDLTKLEYEQNIVSPNKQATISKETADMFSEKDDFISIAEHVTQDENEDSQLTDNWDDAEGYYNIKVGDIINNYRYTIKSTLGQGVFANVVRAQDSNEKNSDVAIKIIRNNELMYQTGLKEVATLKELCKADPEGKYHCVKLLNYFMHKGHLCIVLEPFFMDMRCIIKRYGKHGLNMKALMSYSRQLLMALRLLKKVGVVHADVKPDNILVNEQKNILKLCDFGSAAKVEDNEPTPYLVSRFYRAPEIILGVPYNHNVDTWSAACTIFEMATGKIMFTGSSNNKMLKCFMDLKGKIPSRLIRKGKFKDQHFNFNNSFLLHKKDDVTGREKFVELSNIIITRDLDKELKKYNKNGLKEQRKIIQLKDLLDKMLVLDPRQRLSNIDCLKHSFIVDELQN